MLHISAHEIQCKGHTLRDFVGDLRIFGTAQSLEGFSCGEASPDVFLGQVQIIVDRPPVRIEVDGLIHALAKEPLIEVVGNGVLLQEIHILRIQTILDGLVHIGFNGQVADDGGDPVDHAACLDHEFDDLCDLLPEGRIIRIELHGLAEFLLVPGIVEKLREGFRTGIIHPGCDLLNFNPICEEADRLLGVRIPGRFALGHKPNQLHGIIEQICDAGEPAVGV